MRPSWVGDSDSARDNIAHLYDIVKKVPGDFIEFGVWTGNVLIGMARVARTQGRICHAVDSFQGMAAPTDGDGPEGSTAYPKGKFGAVTPAMIRSKLKDMLEHVVIWEGFVPEILEEIDAPCIAFAHVDLDHHAPTRAAMDWVWPRISRGGVMTCHDYIESQRWMAMKAIRQWMCATGVEPAGVKGKNVWFLKA